MERLVICKWLLSLSFVSQFLSCCTIFLIINQTSRPVFWGPFCTILCIFGSQAMSKYRGAWPVWAVIHSAARWKSKQVGEERRGEEMEAAD